MTTNLALHLIEQFAAQAPFAIWITDSRGVAIFANKRLHELLQIPDEQAGALGFNLFDDPGVEQLGIQKAAERMRAGEIVDMVVEVPEPMNVRTNISVHRKEPLVLRITAYALRNSAQKIEHHVIILDDATASHAQREQLRRHMRDLSIYSKSKDSRQARYDEILKRNVELEEEIRKLGGTPAA